MAYQRLGELDEPLLSTLPVVTKVCHLLQRRGGNEKSLAFIRSHQRRAFQLFNLGETHFPQIAELMRQYANPVFTDECPSTAELAEASGRTDGAKVLSLNRR